MLETMEMTRPSEWHATEAKSSGEPNPFQKQTFFDKIWDACKNEFDFLRNASFSDHLADNSLSVIAGVGIGFLSFVSLGQFGALSSLAGGMQAGMAMSPIAQAITIASLPLNLATAVIKVSFLALYSIIVPYVEEFAFRGILHDMLGGDGASKVEKTLNVLKNAFLFALFHVPTMLPHVSILILLEVFILGIVLAGLREHTGNRAASTAAHITYNSLIFGAIFTLV